MNNDHKSLCSKLFPVSEDEPPEFTLQVIGIQDDNEKTKAEKATMICRSQVLMQTATVMVRSTLGNQSVPVRIILDSGSQRACVTEKLADNLKLKLSPPESDTVAIFRSDKPKQIKYKPTEQQPTLRDGGLMFIKDNVVPYITGTFSHVSLNSEDLRMKFGSPNLLIPYLLVLSTYQLNC